MSLARTDSLPGIYRGICYDNNDPEVRGRIRVKVPMLFGDSPTDWAWPCFPTGSVRTVPLLNTGVWVMFEGGSPDHPVWIGTF